MAGSSSPACRSRVDAREVMQIKEGDKVVILRGPREGSVLVFRVDSFDVLLQKAGIADDERSTMAAKHKPKG
jgi:bifunctional DNA-binding transcriptional regulator/antitoxin component of YhaV-PrlF toxin-antitoxin module